MGEHSSEPSTQIVVHKDEESNNPNPFFALFSKFLQTFFNFPPAKIAAAEPPKPPENTIQPTGPVDEEESRGAVVKYPNAWPAVPPLKLDSEELKRDTNPMVLWEVYVIGGYFVLRWAWARWNERRGKKRPSDDDPSAADD